MAQPFRIYRMADPFMMYTIFNYLSYYLNLFFSSLLFFTHNVLLNHICVVPLYLLLSISFSSEYSPPLNCSEFSELFRIVPNIHVVMHLFDPWLGNLQVLVCGRWNPRGGCEVILVKNLYRLGSNDMLYHMNPGNRPSVIRKANEFLVPIIDGYLYQWATHWLPP